MQDTPTRRQVPPKPSHGWTPPRPPRAVTGTGQAQDRGSSKGVVSAAVSTSRVRTGAPAQGRCPGCPSPLLAPEAEGPPCLPGARAGEDGQTRGTAPQTLPDRGPEWSGAGRGRPASHHTRGCGVSTAPPTGKLRHGAGYPEQGAEGTH